MIFDPISDMFVRIKNANTLCHKSVAVPFSKIKLKIAEILKKEGFIKNYSIEKQNNHKFSNIIIDFLYDLHNKKTISNIKRISKPSLRVYVNAKNIPLVLKGFGIAILSTSKGLITDEQARTLNIGGEVIAYVW